jgi:hypothetical protein
MRYFCVVVYGNVVALSTLIGVDCGTDKVAFGGVVVMTYQTYCV